MRFFSLHLRQRLRSLALAFLSLQSGWSSEPIAFIEFLKVDCSCADFWVKHQLYSKSQVLDLREKLAVYDGKFVSTAVS